MSLQETPTYKLKKRLKELAYEKFAINEKFRWIEKLLSEAKQEMHSLSVEQDHIQSILNTRDRR